MKIHIHYPQKQIEKEVLDKKMSEVYAESLKEYIKLLICTKEEKIQLLKDLKTYIQKNTD